MKTIQASNDIKKAFSDITCHQQANYFQHLKTSTTKIKESKMRSMLLMLAACTALVACGSEASSNNPTQNIAQEGGFTSIPETDEIRRRRLFGTNGYSGRVVPKSCEEHSGRYALSYDPTDDSYWVIQGKLMTEVFPLVECKSRHYSNKIEGLRGMAINNLEGEK